MRAHGLYIPDLMLSSWKSMKWGMAHHPFDRHCTYVNKNVMRTKEKYTTNASIKKYIILERNWIDY